MDKLFIPGPTHVDDEVLEAMKHYPVGHRTADYMQLHAEVVNGIQELLFTRQTILLSTSSATGLMEAAVRNLTQKRVANFICGAFSSRQAEITRLCGLQQDDFVVEWGHSTTPESVDAALSTGKYDLVTVVHNETSTGVMNPLKAIAGVVKNYPDVLLAVDAVSSMMGTPIKVDEWGIDLILASVQKAWALPPGFSVAAISERALERSGQIPSFQKGFYFDFVRMAKSAAKSQTPITPGIPYIYALKKQIERIRKEGLENRFQRHREMAQQVRSWGKETFGLFAESGYESDTLTCFTNKAQLDLIELVSRMKDRGYLLSGGYGDLKGKTFRLAHMGDLQPNDIDDVLGILDSVIGEMA